MTNEIRRNVMLTALRKANNGEEMLFVLDFLADKFGTKPATEPTAEPAAEPAQVALQRLSYPTEPTLETVPF